MILLSRKDEEELIKINNVSLKIINGKEIVRNLSFSLNEKDKLAIIGEEGNGKTTLLKFLYKKELVSEYVDSSGFINVEPSEIGYLPQFLEPFFLDKSIMDFIHLRDDLTYNYDLFNDYLELENFFNQFGVANLFLSEEKMRSTSGGERVKLSLIKLLANNPKLLLLDEPTNDIDLKSIEVLEAFFQKTEIPIIFVSHDVTLLERVSNQILHLEQIKRKQEMRFTYQKIGYREYLEQRELSFQKQDHEAIRTKNEYNKKKEVLSRTHQLVQNDLNAAIKNPSAGRVLAKKMANVKTQERKLDNYEVTEESSQEEGINCFFSPDVQEIPRKKIILNLHDYDLKIKDYLLVKSIDFVVAGGSHIVITGNNGCGKTTLIKVIYNQLKEVPGIILGYMPQNYEDYLDMEKTPVEYLEQFLGYDNETKSFIMNSLGAMKFVSYEMLNKISTLSGGSLAKLYLLKLILLKANVLILDEPTRNLSPISSPKIIMMLKNFKGTIISVSHDRKFIEMVGDTIYEIKSQELIKL